MSIFRKQSKDDTVVVSPTTPTTTVEQPSRRRSMFASKKDTLPPSDMPVTKGSALADARTQLQNALNAEAAAQTALARAKKEAKEARIRVEILVKEADAEMRNAKIKQKEATKLGKHVKALPAS